MIVTLNHPGDLEWVCDLVGGRRARPDAQCLALRDEDQTLRGAVVYEDYTGVSLSMHIAGKGPGWATKDFLWAGFWYPFVQLNCRKVFGLVPASNTHALQVDLKLGFEFEARLSGVFEDGDLLVLSMYKERCRYLAISPSGAMLEQLKGLSDGRQG